MNVAGPACRSGFVVLTLLAWGLSQAQVPSTDTQRYFPAEMHSVQWFAGWTLGTEVAVGLARHSVLGTQRDETGRRIVLLHYDEPASGIIDFLEFAGDEVLLHGSLVHKREEGPLMLDFSPPIPYMRAPVLLGTRWGGGEDAHFEEEVVWQGPRAVLGQVVEDCVGLQRYADGVAQSTSVRCAGVGLVEYTTPVFLGVDQEPDVARFELILRTSARIALVGLQARGDSCEFDLREVGFATPDLVSVSIIDPAGRPLLDTAVALDARAPDVDATSGTIALVFELSPQDMPGAYVVRITGSNDAAIYVLDWPGRCSVETWIPAVTR
jgi:hypothetical protein